MSLDAMVTSFLETALWSTTDDNEDPFDANFSVSDFTAKSNDKAEKTCEMFLAEVERQGLDLSDYDDDQIGHDLWLTIQRHGAGFWDGDYGKELGDKLTKICDNLKAPIGEFAYIFETDGGEVSFE